MHLVGLVGLVDLAILAGGFFLGYVFGAIPFGLLLTRLGGLGDVRNIGSGNIGATNVLRTGHKGLAAATLLLDMLKGAVPVSIAFYWLGADAALAAGMGAFFGHLFPVWLGFRGGKGVATYIGVLAGWAWPAALLFCAAWIVAAFLSRYSSLSALLASIVAPIYLFVSGAGGGVLTATVFLSFMLVFKHRENISRLRAGTESKIGKKG